MRRYQKKNRGQEKCTQKKRINCDIFLKLSYSTRKRNTLTNAYFQDTSRSPHTGTTNFHQLQYCLVFMYTWCTFTNFPPTISQGEASFPTNRACNDLPPADDTSASTCETKESEPFPSTNFWRNVWRAISSS